MSHKPGGPEDHEHEKHFQLGADRSNDDRTEVEDFDSAWAEATTVEQFKADIEELRDAGWPVGD